MKVVDKASIERFRSMDNIATELSVLRRYAEHRHPFILGLECAFQSPTKLHFVMEFVPGGMLFNHLRQQEMFSEKMARFYAAEVCDMEPLCLPCLPLARVPSPFAHTCLWGNAVQPPEEAGNVLTEDGKVLRGRGAGYLPLPALPFPPDNHTHTPYSQYLSQPFCLVY